MDRATPFALAALMILGAAGPAMADDPAGDWRFSATVYGWFSALDAEVDTPRGTVETNLDFADVWDALDFAGFASLQARKDRWSLVGDVNYSALGGSQETPFGAAFSRANVGTTLAIVSAYGAYAIVDEPGFRLEAAAGLRWIHLEADTRLVSAGVARNRAFSMSDTWVDPVIGFRADLPLGERFFLDAFGDIGGFGIDGASSPSAQIYAGFGWRAGDRWALRAGWRSMWISKDQSGSDISLGLHGPVAGVTVSF